MERGSYPIDDARPRLGQIAVPVSSAERTWVIAQAAKAGMSPGEYARTLIARAMAPKCDKS